MAVDDPVIPLDDLTSDPGAPPGGEEGWKRDKNGKEYIVPPGRRGNLYRRGDESVLDAIERDGRPKDQRPRKPKTVKKPKAPTGTDLRELEEILSEAFKAPAVVCAMAGDEWAANHFTMSGPALARNLVVSSEKNPWLRKKLEDAATGGDAMVQLMTMFALGGAIFMYIAPPAVHWFNLPVPNKAREMFGIPDRRMPDGAPAHQEPTFAAAA